MQQFKVIITETLAKEITILAEDEDEAYLRAEEQVENEDVVLDWQDFQTRNIEVFKEDGNERNA